MFSNLKKKLLRAAGIQWHDMRSVEPASRFFGFDRGTGIDRYYIEQFLSKHRQSIQGDVLEVAESTYTKKFGSNLTASHALHFSPGKDKSMIAGDLTKTETLKKDAYNCFICTQTFNVIYDVQKAVEGTHYLLNEGGVVLVTVAGLCQVSAYDMERWGDYWRFTTKSIERIFGDVFGLANIEIESYGNCLSAISILKGLSAEELSKEELDYKDKDYQVIITIKAVKRSK